VLRQSHAVDGSPILSASLIGCQGGNEVGGAVLAEVLDYVNLGGELHAQEIRRAHDLLVGDEARPEHVVCQ
jgi:hypothetical protein